MSQVSRSFLPQSQCLTPNLTIGPNPAGIEGVGHRQRAAGRDFPAVRGMRSTGFEPAPVWLKARDAAVTPQPQSQVGGIGFRRSMRITITSRCRQTRRRNKKRGTDNQTRMAYLIVSHGTVSGQPGPFAQRVERRSNPRLRCFKPPLIHLSYRPGICVTCARAWAQKNLTSVRCEVAADTRRTVRTSTSMHHKLHRQRKDGGKFLLDGC